MRILEKTLLACMLLLLMACNNKNDTALDNRLTQLVKDKEYFLLKAELGLAEKKLSEDRYLFYKAICDDVFNDIPSSQKCVQTLFDRYNEQLADSTIKKLLEIKVRNHIRESEYADAVSSCQLLLGEYGNELDSLEKVKYQDTHSMYKKLINVGPLTVHKSGNIEIKSNRNPYLGFITVPVSDGKNSAEFLFDTGADMSVITKRFANELGLTIYEVDTDVETTLGIVKANIAVADSLYLGDILFENVMLLVMPVFNIPELDFRISGIMGVNEMRKLEEIQVRQDGSIFIPETLSESELSNLYFDNLEGLSLTVRIQSDNDFLSMGFDTGANTSMLSKKFYTRYRDKVGVESNESSVFAAGRETQKIESYTLKDFPYTIGSKQCVLPEIDIELSDYDYNDGLVGQDMILPFDKMIINFRSMYVDFE